MPPVSTGTFRAVGIAVGHPGVPLSDALGLAVAAEEAGLGLVAAGEGFGENFSLMGALAASTGRVELFTSVVGRTRTPVTTALAAATLQELAGGRYRLGLGSMPREWSEGWHGIAYDRLTEQMRDYVAAVRTAYAAPPGLLTDHEGPFYRFRGYERFAAAPLGSVPIYLAATRPAMTELAGEIADGVIFNTISSAEWLRDALHPRLERGLERAGRDRVDLDVGVLLYCAVADDPQEAVELAKPGLAFYFPIPYFADVLEHHGFTAELDRGRKAARRRDTAGMVAAVSDEMVEVIAVVGTPEHVSQKLRRYEGLVDWVELSAPLGHDPQAVIAMTERIVDAFAPSRIAVGGGS
jgi:alkanesulfonate monooxygenase SsuD/methylene tetrahydromethanopterin reductase-like flavin-dependent oxidoreductase (luciferase family)